MAHKKPRRGNPITRGVKGFFKAIGEIISTIFRLIWNCIKGFFKLIEEILEFVLFWS